jgi:regulator of nonsense transcripts 1
MRDSNNRRFEGTASETKGKTTTILLQKGKGPSNLRSVKVVGLQDATNSERTRDELLYLVLAGQKSLQESPFIQRVWFPHRFDQTTSTATDSGRPEKVSTSIKLNDSQCNAMRAMVGKSPIVVVHGTFDTICYLSRVYPFRLEGPPGTGKTTTITAAAQVWESRNFSVWIVAHSNVAVKNIAEKLFDKKVDFKILVSKEFHEEWSVLTLSFRSDLDTLQA